MHDHKEGFKIRVKSMTCRNKTVPQAAAVIAAAALVCIVVAFWQFKTQSSLSRTAQTRSLLISYAEACVSYHRTTAQWPAALADLFSSKDGVTFVNPGISKRDAWGHLLVYEPFDPSLGFARIRSVGAAPSQGRTRMTNGIIVQFDDTVVTLVGVTNVSPMP
jgi:hypothetical protein